MTGQRVHLGLHLSAPGFVRLAYSWNPSLEVRVDGERVDAVETAGGYLAIELPAGEHAIELIPHWSGLRRALAGLDATVLLAGAGMWWRRRRR